MYDKRQSSSVSIYRHRYTNHWVMSAYGMFAAGFTDARLKNTGHAIALIHRYVTNPKGCTIYVEDGHPDADLLRGMATA